MERNLYKKVYLNVPSGRKMGECNPAHTLMKSSLHDTPIETVYFSLYVYMYLLNSAVHSHINCQSSFHAHFADCAVKF